MLNKWYISTYSIFFSLISRAHIFHDILSDKDLNLMLLFVPSDAIKLCKNHEDKGSKNIELIAFPITSKTYTYLLNFC